MSEKTLGDSDNFYDKLPEEILDEIKNFIRQESDKVLDNEIIAHEDPYDKFYIHAFPAERYRKKVERFKKNTFIRVIGICKGKTFLGNIKIVNCKVFSKKK